MKKTTIKAIMTELDRHDACQILAYARLRVDPMSKIRLQNDPARLGWKLARSFLSRCIEHVQAMETTK